MDLDAHVPAARHVEIARPAARTRQNVAGRRNDFRPHVRDTRANAASERSIASGQAIAAPRTRNINDRDAQGAHGLTVPIGRHEDDRGARDRRGAGRKIHDAGVERECGEEGNAARPRSDPSA